MPSPSFVIPSIRESLRDDTRAAHERVDRIFSTLDLADRSDYEHFLRAHAAALQAIEARLFVAMKPTERPPVVSDFAVADLTSLGQKRPLATFHRGLSGAHPIGLSYVISGAHYGGAVLRRHWSRSKDRAVLDAGRYLKSTSMKDYWPRFLSLLDTHSFDPAERIAMIDSAGTAFAVFVQAFHEAHEGALV